MGENQMKKLSIFFADGALVEEVSKELRSYLLKNSVEVLPKEELEHLQSAENLTIISLGGDGTFLKASRLALKIGASVFGVNLGSLGFLTDVEGVDVFSAVDSFLEGNYFVEKRMTLRAKVSGENIEDSFFAVNDFVVMRDLSDKILQTEAVINGFEVGKFRSDGFVVSTPTGSTAYSLSLGGPIIAPQARVFCLVFAAPHKLSARPVIFSCDDKLTMKILSDGNFSLQRDGEIVVHLSKFDRLAFTKNERDLEIIHLANKNFFDVLNKKFGWGL
jgi:NAD+ kinase